MAFRERMKELRLEKKMTIVQVAALLEKTEAAIRAWETGRTKPDMDTIIRLSDYFGCSADYLLGLTDQKKNAARRRLDETAESIFTRQEKLALYDQEYLLEVYEKTLACLENLQESGEACEVYKSFFYRLFSDIVMGGDLLAGASRRTVQDAAKVKDLLKRIRQMSETDLSALWAAFEKALDPDG